MPRSPRRSRTAAAGAVLFAAGLLAGAGCAALPAGTAVPARTPLESYRELLGRNPGLNSLRAEVEARFSYAGREISLPGVLLLDGLEGFRIDLLDPLDRPLALLFTRDGTIVQYRPGQRLAAALGVLPEGCRGLAPDDWVPAVLAARPGPVSGERLAEHRIWGGRSLEIHRDGKLRSSVHFSTQAGRLVPGLVTWYCGEDAALQLRVRDWLQGTDWRLPSRIDVKYPQAGLTVRLELRGIEANPPPTGSPLRPEPGAGTRWSSWNLPR